MNRTGSENEAAAPCIRTNQAALSKGHAAKKLCQQNAGRVEGNRMVIGGNRTSPSGTLRENARSVRN